MFKSLIALLALLIFGAVATGPAQASVFHRFAVGVDTPQQLATLVRASLAKDSSGASVVSEESCRKLACATPADYLAMFQQSDPESGLTSVSQLPAFLDSLVVRAAPTGRYWMACKTGVGNAASKPQWNCLARTFHKGETAFVNPKTGRIVLARDCTNPVGKEDLPDDCIYQHVYLKPGDVIHRIYAGPDKYPAGKCVPALMRAGSDEWETRVLDECPGCDFSKAFKEQVRFRKWDPAKAQLWEDTRSSLRAEREGWYVYRERKEVISSRSDHDLCVVHQNGSQTLTTYMAGVTYNAGHSYVTYSGLEQSKPPADWKGTPHPWRIFPSGELN